jgi:GDP-L-fucose synthase
VNLGSGHEVSIRDLAVLIGQEVGYQGELVWDTTRPNGQPRRCLDVAKAVEYFNFHAKQSLQEGIRRTVTWFLDNRASIREVVF